MIGYIIAGQRYYNIALGAFVDTPDDAPRYAPLIDNGEYAGEDYLRQTLLFYGQPVGMGLMSLVEAQASKRGEINAGFDAAMTASLTMPSASTPPSAFTIYQAIEAWKAEDLDGYNYMLAIHTARRDALLTAVAAADTADAVQAVAVSYAV